MTEAKLPEQIHPEGVRSRHCTRVKRLAVELGHDGAVGFSPHQRRWRVVSETRHFLADKILQFAGGLSDEGLV